MILSRFRTLCSLAVASLLLCAASFAAPAFAVAAEAFPDPVATPEMTAALRGEQPAFAGLTALRVEQFQTRREQRVSLSDTGPSMGGPTTGHGFFLLN